MNNDNKVLSCAQRKLFKVTCHCRLISEIYGNEWSPMCLVLRSNFLTIMVLVVSKEPGGSSVLRKVISENYVIWVYRQSFYAWKAIKLHLNQLEI